MIMIVYFETRSHFITLGTPDDNTFFFYPSLSGDYYIAVEATTFY